MSLSLLLLSWHHIIDREKGLEVWWWAQSECCHYCHYCIVVVVQPGAPYHHAMVAQPIIVQVALHHSCHVEWWEAQGCGGGTVVASTWHCHCCCPYHGVVVRGMMVRKVCCVSNHGHMTCHAAWTMQKNLQVHTTRKCRVYFIRNLSSSSK